MQIGRRQTLTVIARHGERWRLTTAAIPEREATMPCADQPGLAVGDSIDAFVYADAEGRPVATVDRPAIELGQCAGLTVASVDALGAWLDWGLGTELLLPYAEQRRALEPGMRESVVLRLDKQTRPVASARLDRHLDARPSGLEARQAVSLLPFQRTDLGIKAVIGHDAIGLLYRDEVFREVRLAERCPGWVRRVRDDGRIDLSLQPPRGTGDDALDDAILAHIRDAGGATRLSDRSSPDIIRDTFGVSKKHYKRALARLYREARIEFDADIVRLGESER